MPDLTRPPEDFLELILGVHEDFLIESANNTQMFLFYNHLTRRQFKQHRLFEFLGGQMELAG